MLKKHSSETDILAKLQRTHRPVISQLQSRSASIESDANDDNDHTPPQAHPFNEGHEGLPGLAEFQASDDFKAILEEEGSELEASKVSKPPQKLREKASAISYSSLEVDSCASTVSSENEKQKNNSILAKLRRYRSSHALTGKDSDQALDAFSSDSSDSPFQEKPSNRLRRYHSAHSDGSSTRAPFFRSIRDSFRADVSHREVKLDHQILKRIKKELAHINASLHEHHGLEIEKKPFVDGLKQITDAWDDAQKNNLLNLLQSAKYSIAGSLDDLVDDHDKEKFILQKRRIGEDILNLFGETRIKYDHETKKLIGNERYNFVDWKAGMNNCLAVLEDRETDTQFVIKSSSIACHSLLDQTSFLHAYKKNLDSIGRKEGCISDLYAFYFPTDMNYYLPSYDDQDCSIGFGQVIQIGAFYNNSPNLHQKYFQQTTKQEVVALTEERVEHNKANRIYHATLDWQSVSQSILELYKRGILYTDIKGGNLMEHPKTGRPMIVDFKTARIVDRHSDNLIKKIPEIEITAAYYEPDFIRGDKTIPVIYVLCQAILISYYESITLLDDNLRSEYNQQRRRQLFDLDPITSIYGKEIPILSGFFVKWEQLLSPEEPQHPDSAYLELMVKHFDQLTRNLMPDLCKHLSPVKLTDIESVVEEAIEEGHEVGICLTSQSKIKA